MARWSIAPRRVLRESGTSEKNLGRVDFAADRLACRVDERRDERSEECRDERLEECRDERLYDCSEGSCGAFREDE